MKILGRKQEIEVLNRMCQSSSPEFLALYGRRRVGKTFLIKQFFKEQDVIFFNVTGAKEGGFEEQTSNFIKRIGEVFYNGLALEKVKNWNKLFAILTKAIDELKDDRKVVLFFDELPWMATRNSRLLENIDYYWNQYWSDNARIKLIICGSSASWIINKIIRNTGGLHNRLTERIHLEPFNLHDTKAYLDGQNIKLDKKQILLLYFVTGGVPYYLSKIQWNLSAIQIIEKLAFSRRSFLLEEFDNLFASLFNDHRTHIKIVRLLAENRYGIGKRKLLEMVGTVGGNSSQRLQELEDAGFITSFKPLYHKRKGVYYRLIDEYTFFYLQWLSPIRDSLQKQGLAKGDWQAFHLTTRWKSWLGYAFETACYKHLTQIKNALDLPPISIASTWRYAPLKGTKEEGAQIDLLFDRKDGVIHICEIKYSDKPFIISKEYSERLKRKIRVFKQQTRTSKQLFVTFITLNGVKNNKYYGELVSSVVVLDALFKN